MISRNDSNNRSPTAAGLTELPLRLIAGLDLIIRSSVRGGAYLLGEQQAASSTFNCHWCMCVSCMSESYIVCEHMHAFLVKAYVHQQTYRQRKHTISHKHKRLHTRTYYRKHFTCIRSRRMISKPDVRMKVHSCSCWRRVYIPTNQPTTQNLLIIASAHVRTHILPNPLYVVFVRERILVLARECICMRVFVHTPPNLPTT
jgi:hypothetical protein